MNLFSFFHHRNNKTLSADDRMQHEINQVFSNLQQAYDKAQKGDETFDLYLRKGLLGLMKIANGDSRYTKSAERLLAEHLSIILGNAYNNSAGAEDLPLSSYVDSIKLTIDNSVSMKKWFDAVNLGSVDKSLVQPKFNVSHDKPTSKK